MMKRSSFPNSVIIVLFAFIAVLSAPSALAQPGPPASPTAGLKGLDSDGRMQISREDRCPVCAMRVAEYPKFSSAIQLKDGRTYYFCAAGCMIRSWLHPEIFLGAGRGRLGTAVVRDYFTGEQVDALSVTWIAGSDVIGPMGPVPVPIKGEENVEVFRRRHGGKTTFRLSELDDAKWEAITGRKALPADR